MGDQGIIIIMVLAVVCCSVMAAAGGGLFWYIKYGGGLGAGSTDGGDVYNRPGDVVWLYSETGYSGKMQGFKPGEYSNVKASFQDRPGADFGVKSMKVTKGYKAFIWHEKGFTINKGGNRWGEITTDKWDLKEVKQCKDKGCDATNLGTYKEYEDDVISMKVLKV